MSSITLYIADDQQMVREALTVLLNLQPDLEVIGASGDGQTAFAEIQKLSPNIALLDIEMPELNGIAVTAKLSESRSSTKALIVTTFGRPGYLARALEAGARGFVVKDTPAAQLAESIRKIHSGLKVIDPALVAETFALGKSPLSEREQDVLRASRGGSSIVAISKQLSLSHGTVRNHISNAMAKLNAENRFNAAQQAEQNGWL